MRPEDWSDKQLQVYQHIMNEDYHTIIMVGPIQSGKSFAGAFWFHYWAFMNFNNEDFIIGHRTDRQLKGSIIKYSQQFSDLFGGGWRRTSEGYLMGNRFGGTNRFIPAFGGTRGSEERVRSYSVRGALVDEAVTLDPDFVTGVQGRCSKPGAKLVLITNPGKPLHPIKKKYVDAVEHDPNMSLIQFELADNPGLTDNYLRRMDKWFDGAAHDRMIKGLWSAEDGPVYPRLMESVSEPPKAGARAWTVGIDYAESSSTHAVFVAEMPDRVCWVMDEWEHTGFKRGELSAPEQANRIVKYAYPRNIRRWAIDATALPLISAIGRKSPRARMVVEQTDVGLGIYQIKHQMSTGRLWISKNCEKLIEQMANYEWDPRWKEHGEDKPVKKNDHGCDALRYDRMASVGSRTTTTVRRM